MTLLSGGRVYVSLLMSSSVSKAKGKVSGRKCRDTGRNAIKNTIYLPRIKPK